jgi:RNA polymerase sigma-70 factor (ECF subfamily)
MALPDSEIASDSVLLEQCRDGDEQAFGRLVAKYHPRLMASAIGMLGKTEDAEDAVQQTFIRFYGAMRRFEGRSSLATYLTRITMNESLKILRKQKPWRLRLVSRDDPENPVQEPLQFPEQADIERSEQAILIRKAVQSLKPEYRNVVVLRFLNEYSTAECAEILEIPQGTVMSRLSRALRKLGPVLQSIYEK